MQNFKDHLRGRRAFLAPVPPQPQPMIWSQTNWNESFWSPVANNNNQENTTMLQNLIELNIPDADWTDIDAAILVLETKLGAKLLDLTPQQRQSLNKMGDLSEPFCRQSLVIGRQNVAELTTRATAALTKAEGDLGGCDKLRPRLTRLISLTEKGNDSEMALGSDVMEYALFQYGFLSATGAGAGLDELYAQLSQRFGRQSPQPTPAPTPTPPPTPPA
jgi:hypothetical protein